MGSPSIGKVTVPEILARKPSGPRIAMLTAYDCQTAAILDEAGVDILLVGDSLGMVVLGYDNTLPVTQEEMLHHTRAVARGRRRALLVADLPYLSYHISPRETVRNSGRFLKEAGADAVKLEGGVRRRKTIEALVEAEIPVMGHIGLTPQSIHQLGGYRVQGGDPEKARDLLEDALAVQEAGAFCVVLEGIPEPVAATLTNRLRIPTIGIGAGRQCDGQVLVTNDLLGMGKDRPPRFVRRYADLRSEIDRATRGFIADIRRGMFPSEKETYGISESLEADLCEALKAGYGDH